MTASRLPRPIRFGRYEAIGKLGSGGMATVYVGRAVGGLGLGQAVAVKVLHPHLAEARESVRRLIDEARIVARIHHPNVVRLIDAVAEENQLFLVLEYVHGCSFAELLAAGRESRDLPTPAVAAAIVHQALLGLHGAHEARGENGELLDVVHRDISPHNILVSTAGTAHVLDFGIARAQERLHETKSDSVVGKMLYMAPEQLAGETLNRRTDLYAMGIVLWEALSGEMLFQSSTARAGALVPGWVPKRPSEHNSEVPAALDALVAKLLAVEPERRFATAEAAATALAVACPLAPATAVAEWVRGVVADRLEALDDLLQSALRSDFGAAEMEGAIERSYSSASGTSQRSYSSASGTSQRSRRALPSLPPSPVSSPTALRDRGGPSLAPPSVEVPAGARGSPRRRAAIAGLLVTVILVLGVVLLRRSRDGSATQAARPDTSGATSALPDGGARSEVLADAAAAAAAAQNPAPSAEPRASASAAPADSVVRSGTRRGRPGPAVRPPPSEPRPATSASAAAAARCNPPYFIDDQGIKIFRPECVPH